MNLPNCHVNSSWKLEIGSFAKDSGRREPWALQVWRTTYNDEIKETWFFYQIFSLNAKWNTILV